MALYPSRIHAVFFGLGELARYAIFSRAPDWSSWFLPRLADRSLSERRRRTIVVFLIVRATKRSNAKLARDIWLAGRDLWNELRRPTIALLACEASAWLKDRPTFEDAFAVGSSLFTDSTKARLEFLREVYLTEPTPGVPRLIPLPGPRAHDGLLHFVDDYARARVADSHDRFAVAREYYERALKTLPQDHPAFNFAVSRCNAFRNMPDVRAK